MRLFDLSNEEKSRLRRFWRWHLAYLLVVALYFSLIYFFGLFRSGPLFREKFIFLVLAPLSTVVFVLLSPWRRHFWEAIVETHRRLDGQVIFCLMAGFVFVFGFFMYSVFIWGLGALGPALLHM